MGGQDNGLTLEGLAKRLESLERENEQMRSENAELRDEVNVLRGSRTHREEQAENSGSDGGRHKQALSRFEGKVSRRSLLSKAGVATAGLVVAGALTQRDIREAKAAQVIGDSNQEFRGGVEGTNNAQFGYGVMGRATDGWAVDGQSERTGVRGISNQVGGGIGVQGIGHRGVHGFGNGPVGSDTKGVHGECSNGFGVQGTGQIGVYGNSSAHGSPAVYGQHTGTGNGVWGSTAATDYAAVYGQHTGSLGYGIIGDGKGASGAGALGRNPSGSGVRGEGNNGVHGKATGGYGGLLEGGKAQLRLVPKGTAGKPSGSHTKGEIYMDSAGTMFICVASSTSTAAAKWRKVTTTAV